MLKSIINIISEFQEFNICLLTRELVATFANEIVKSLDLIPHVNPHSIEDIFAETKGDRVLYAKWEHSLIALANNERFAGIAIGYERKKEGNNQYPENCIYLSDLSVVKNFQKRGLGKFLSQLWVEYNAKVGFLELEGNLKFCVQTNKAEWNSYVKNCTNPLGL